MLTIPTTYVGPIVSRLLADENPDMRRGRYQLYPVSKYTEDPGLNVVGKVSAVGVAGVKFDDIGCVVVRSGLG